MTPALLIPTSQAAGEPDLKVRALDLPESLDDALGALLRGEVNDCLVCGEVVEVDGDRAACRICGALVEPAPAMIEGQLALI